MLLLLCSPAAVYLHPRVLRMFFTVRVCPGFQEAQESGREASGRQSRCENTAVGIERQSRWRRADPEEQVFVPTAHARFNLALPLSLFSPFSAAAAGAAPRAPSHSGPRRPPHTSPTTRLRLRWAQRQPPPTPCPWRLTRAPPIASPLPCSPRRTHITPICSLLQRPCLHHHH